jgi:type IV pilus assembly protein PilM
MLHRNTQFIGLDMGSKVLKAVQLRSSRRNGFRLISLGFEDLSPDSIADEAGASPSLVPDAIRRIFSEQGFRNRRIATSIAGHSVIVKRISLPFQSNSNLSESIRWEAEQHIPFDIDEVNLDYQVLRHNARTETLDILLVAGKKEKIEENARIIEMANKTPVLVDVDAFALQNAYEINYRPTDGTISALIDIGATTTTISIISGTDFLFTRDVGIGGHQYTQSIQREFNLGFHQAESLKYGESAGNIRPEEVRRLIDSTTETVCLEIQKTYDFLKSTISADHIDRMIVGGGSAHTPGLIETLARKFGVPVEKFDSFKTIAYDPTQFSSSVISDRSPDLAVAVGLALRSAGPPFLSDSGAGMQSRRGCQIPAVRGGGRL